MIYVDNEKNIMRGAIMVRKGILSIIVSFSLFAIPNYVYSEYESMKSLEGIKSVQVVYTVEKVGNLTNDQIKNDTELKLLQSKIKMDDTSNNLLLVSVEAKKYSEDTIVYFTIHISLIQPITIVRNAFPMFGITWIEYYYGFVGVNMIQDIRIYVKDCLDKFIIDYLKANTIE